jgi:hypothetical protein
MLVSFEILDRLKPHLTASPTGDGAAKPADLPLIMKKGAFLMPNLEQRHNPCDN